jgi:hypothetical protein
MLLSLYAVEVRSISAGGIQFEQYARLFKSVGAPPDSTVRPSGSEAHENALTLLKTWSINVR